VTSLNLKSIIRDQVDKKARIITDDLNVYRGLRYEFRRHDIIKHSEKEYVRGDVHTNTVEGYFGILKRGINGTYHHVKENHLHRYLSEFDFRYNKRVGRGYTDMARADALLSGIIGKRLTYQTTN